MTELTIFFWLLTKTFRNQSFRWDFDIVPLKSIKYFRLQLSHINIARKKLQSIKVVLYLKKHNESDCYLLSYLLNRLSLFIYLFCQELVHTYNAAISFFFLIRKHSVFIDWADCATVAWNSLHFSIFLNSGFC